MCRGQGLGGVADDVGVEEVAGHRSVSRLGSRGRARSRSAPTRGERRRAARMPPGAGGSPVTRRSSVARVRGGFGAGLG